MATKKSVFLSTETVDWIKKTTADDLTNPKWSESINASFSQFRYLIRESVPDLSPADWRIILNIYSGCIFPAHRLPVRIARDIMDDIGEIDISKMPAEYSALIRKLHDLSQLQQMAILYFVQIFWLRKWENMEWQNIFDTIKNEF